MWPEIFRHLIFLHTTMSQKKDLMKMEVLCFDKKIFRYSSSTYIFHKKKSPDGPRLSKEMRE